MKKLLVVIVVIFLFLTSSCDFVKERFLDGDPLYGGGHMKGTNYSPTPVPTEEPDSSE